MFTPARRTNLHAPKEKKTSRRTAAPGLANPIEKWSELHPRGHTAFVLAVGREQVAVERPCLMPGTKLLLPLLSNTTANCTDKSTELHHSDTRAALYCFPAPPEPRAMS